MRRTLLLAAGLIVGPGFAAPAPLAGQGPRWQVDIGAVAIRLPAWLSADSLRASLSYEPDTGTAIAGFLADLNGDGTPDSVFRVAAAICGTNCQYALVDGQTHRSLGTVGGSVIVVRPPLLNGYPTIGTYGHSSAEAGYWSTWVFDGAAYVTVETVHVEGASQTRLFESLRDIPGWPPPPRGPR